MIPTQKNITEKKTKDEKILHAKNILSFNI